MPVRGEPSDVGVGEMHAVGEPHVGAEGAQVVEQLDRAAAERLEAERLLVVRLRDVRVQPDAEPPCERGRLLHEPLGAENGEQGATAIRSIEPGVGS